MSDGRNVRSDRTRAQILRACRGLMASGVLQPSTEDVAKFAGRSVRSVFHHYGSAENMRAAAMDDVDTKAAVWRVLLGAFWLDETLDNFRDHPVRDRVLFAVTQGRLP